MSNSGKQPCRLSAVRGDRYIWPAHQSTAARSDHMEREYLQVLLSPLKISTKADRARACCSSAVSRISGVHSSSFSVKPFSNSHVGSRSCMNVLLRRISLVCTP